MTEVVAARAHRTSRMGTPYLTALDRFKDEHYPTLAPLTRKKYSQGFAVLEQFLKDKTLKTIDTADLAAFTTFRRAGGVCGASIRRDLSALSSLFTFSIDNKLCQHNPVTPYLREKKYKKQLTENPPRSTYIDHMQELTLLNRTHSAAKLAKGFIRPLEKYMELFCFALHIETGLRPQEMLQAEWSWINYHRSELSVPAKAAKFKKPRIVPLSDRARQILALIPRHIRSPYILWRTTSGKRFKDLNKTMQKLAASVGIHDVVMHDLRRTFGCRTLQDRKASIETVSMMLGHEDIGVTQDVYAFLKIEDAHEAMGTRRMNDEAKAKLADFFNHVRVPDFGHDFIKTEAADTNEIDATDDKKSA